MAPDGNDVGEQDHKAEEVPEPRAHEALQRHHDDGQNQLGQEQGFGEAVQLQVQKAHLRGRSEPQG